MIKDQLAGNKDPDQNVDSMNLGDFFDLHEWRSHEVLKTTITTDDPADDPEIKHISNYTESDKTTIIFTNGTPAGLLEANLGTDAESQLQEREISPPAPRVRRGRRRTRGGTVANRDQIRTRRRPHTNDDNNTRNVKKFAAGTLPDQLTINEETEFKIEIKNSAASTG